jgi:hypothetical protein
MQPVRLSMPDGLTMARLRFHDKSKRLATRRSRRPMVIGRSDGVAAVSVTRCHSEMTSMHGGTRPFSGSLKHKAMKLRELLQAAVWGERELPSHLMRYSDRHTVSYGGRKDVVASGSLVNLRSQALRWLLDLLRIKYKEWMYCGVPTDGASVSLSIQARPIWIHWMPHHSRAWSLPAFNY